MSLHQQVLADAPATSRSDVFRLKAQFSEQRAQECDRSVVKTGLGGTRNRVAHDGKFSRSRES